MRPSRSAPLFRTLLTARLTGQSRTTPLSAGRSNAVRSPPAVSRDQTADLGKGAFRACSHGAAQAVVLTCRTTL